MVGKEKIPRKQQINVYFLGIKLYKIYFDSMSHNIKMVNHQLIYHHFLVL